MEPPRVFLSISFYIFFSPLLSLPLFLSRRSSCLLPQFSSSSLSSCLPPSSFLIFFILLSSRVLFLSSPCESTHELRSLNNALPVPALGQVSKSMLSCRRNHQKLKIRSPKTGLLSESLSGGPLERSWLLLEGSLVVLGGHLDALVGHLEGSWTLFGRVLEALGALLESS